jgi:hypothetical protein
VTQKAKRGGKRPGAGRPRVDQYEGIDALILARIGSAVPNADHLADAQTRRAILIASAARLHCGPHRICDERTGGLRRITEDDIARADVADPFWERIFIKLIGSSAAAVVRRLRARQKPIDLRLDGKIIWKGAHSPYANDDAFARPIASRVKREN